MPELEHYKLRQPMSSFRFSDADWTDDDPLLRTKTTIELVEQVAMKGSLFETNLVTPSYLSPAGYGPKKKMTFRDHAGLSSYWFGWAFLWMPLLVVIIPSQVANIVGDASKGSALGQTMLMGSFISVFCAPIIGSASDSCKHKLGRRRPFMIVGTFVATVALLIMAISTDLATFSCGFLILSFANNMVISPYSALVPDVVPSDQRGIASGWLGSMSMLGYLFSGLVCFYLNSIGFFTAYLILIFVHGLCMIITCYTIEEEPICTVLSPSTIKDRCNSFWRPFKNHDFLYVFGTRFLMQMGIITVQEYLQYYLQDAIGSDNFTFQGKQVASNAQQAVAILFLPLLFGSLISSLVAGIVSDRYGGKRKSIIYFCSGLMALACFAFSISRNFTIAAIVAFIFGAGFGGFSVMDWALATDVLPDPKEFAKDMGIWSLAMVLPQVIAAPIAGYLLDFFQNVNRSIGLGYSVIFLVSVLYFCAGAYFVKKIHAVD